jgi:hypothetical protein
MSEASGNLEPNEDAPETPTPGAGTPEAETSGSPAAEVAEATGESPAAEVAEAKTGEGPAAEVAEAETGERPAAEGEEAETGEGPSAEVPEAETGEGLPAEGEEPAGSSESPEALATESPAAESPATEQPAPTNDAAEAPAGPAIGEPVEADPAPVPGSPAASPQGTSPVSAGATLASGEDPAAWAREPKPEGAFEHLGAWYRRQPVFATILIVTVLGSPWFVTRAWESYQRATLTAGLDAWQVRLEEAGLPLPFAEVQAPPTPVDLPQDEGRYQRSGLASRYRALKSWSALLAGDELPKVAKDPGPLESALAACRFLRQAASVSPPDAQALELAAGYIKTAPGELSEALELNHAYLEGEDRRVAAQVDAVLKGKPRIVSPGLAGLRRVLYQARVQRVLRQTPPSSASLAQLLPLAGRSELGIPKLLAAEGAGLARVLQSGGGDLKRAHVLLDILRAASPNAPFEVLGEARQPVLDGFDGVLERHLTQDEVTQDAEVRRLCLRLILMEPEADLPTFKAFGAWREQLKRAIDRPDALLALARRTLEVGRLPGGLEDFLVSHYLSRGHAAPPESKTPGELLLRVLLASLHPDGDEPQQEGAQGPQGYEEWRQELVERLAGRKDPVAGRQRALAAFLVGEARLRAGKAEQARKAFVEAQELGYTQRERLFASLVAVLRHTDPPAALAAAKSRVQALRLHARRLPKLQREMILMYELEGWGVHERVMEPRRVAAFLDLAELSEAKPARKAVDQALALQPHNARANYVSAKLYAAAKNNEAARQAIFRGLRGALPEQVELKRELRELLQTIGPN